MRLIDADWLMKFYEPYDENFSVFLDVVKEHIRNAPTIDPESLRIKGKWLWKDRQVNKNYKVTGWTEMGDIETVSVHDDYIESRNYCSVCGKLGDDTFMNYCPNCGADMRGDDNETD